jgi:hypothetical protein
MRLASLLLAGLLFATPALAGEITLLKGGPITGDIVSVTNKEVTVNDGGTLKKLPIAGVLKLDYALIGKPKDDDRYSLVELTDGSILAVSSLSIKKKQVELSLLVGGKATLPLDVLSSILVRGEVEKFRFDWKDRVLNAKGRDAIVVNRAGVASNVFCTFGEGNKDGTKIAAAVVIDDEVVNSERILGRIKDDATPEEKKKEDRGFIFKYTLGPKAPSPVCKLFDTIGDTLYVADVLPGKDGALTVTTPAGVKIEFTKAQLARLDYTPGKLDYLSDLVPSKIVAKSNLDEDAKPDQWHVYKDKNLNMGKITLGGVAYPKGLALKPLTELTFDIKGNYRDLSFLVGLDDNVSASGASILIIEGDGKEIAQAKIDSADKVRFKSMKLNVKDVKELKIIVKSTGLFDTGRHLDLADIKVSK